MGILKKILPLSKEEARRRIRGAKKYESYLIKKSGRTVVQSRRRKKKG